MVQIYLQDSTDNEQTEVPVSKLTQLGEIRAAAKQFLKNKGTDLSGKKIRLIFGGRILDEQQDHFTVWKLDFKEGSVIIMNTSQKPAKPQTQNDKVAIDTQGLEEIININHIESAYEAKKTKEGFICSYKQESDFKNDKSGIPSYLIQDRWIRLWLIPEPEKASKKKNMIIFTLPPKYKVEKGTSLRLLRYLEKGGEGLALFGVIEAQAELVKQEKTKDSPAKHYIKFTLPEKHEIGGYYTVGIQNDELAKQGCLVCTKNDHLDKQLLCDECDAPYHDYCLKPPIKIEDLGEEDKWFCPKCENKEMKTQKNRLKEVSKKKLTAKGNLTTKKWGGGNSCAAMKEHCTIVAKTHFGKIPGILVGKHFRGRLACAESGVHRAPVSGITGRGKTGSFSIALAGGYEDDNDKGDEFVYTGSGGRNLKEGNRRTADQSSHQEWIRVNLALARNSVKFSCETCSKDMDSKTICSECEKNWKDGKPVRVIRKFIKPKKKRGTNEYYHISKYAPTIEDSVRYDGLYKVVNYWRKSGDSGYKVCQYLLRRDDDEPAPWTKEGKETIKKFNLDVLPPKKLTLKQMEQLAKKQAAEQTQNKKRKRSPKLSKGQTTLKLKKGKENKPPRKKAKTVQGDESDSDSIVIEETEETVAPKVEVETEEMRNLKNLIASDTVNQKTWEVLLSRNSLAIHNRGEFLKAVIKEFTCIICLEPMKHPVVTSCGHGCCSVCFMLATQQLNKDDESFPCFVCRAPVDPADAKENKKLWKILICLFPHLAPKKE